MGKILSKSPSSNNVYKLSGVMVKDKDLSDTTAVASDVLSGKYFYLANGTKTEGSIPTYSGSTTITENGTVATSGKYMNTNLTVNVSAEESDGYIRPADWLPIPTMDGTQDEVYILFGVGKYQFNQIQMRLKGICTIDWGDGTTSTSINVEQPFEHTWDPDTISSSTWTEHNQSKQVLIHIYGNRGAIQKISTAGYITYTNEAGTAQSYASQSSSDIYHIKGNVASATVICHDSGSVRHGKLEMFEWTGAMTNTSFSSMFSDSYNLARVSGVDTSNATNCSSMFYNCRSLVGLNRLDLNKVTNASSMFNQCSSIKKIKFINANKITNAQSMFASCDSLQELPDIDLKNTTSLTWFCSSCYALSKVSDLDTRNVTDFSGVFTNCTALKIAPMMNTKNATNMSQLYSNCYSLTYCPTYDMRNVTTANGMFNACYTLKRFPKVNTSKLTVFTNMFNNCHGATIGPAIDMRLVTTGANSVISSSYALTKGIKLYDMNPSYSGSITVTYTSASQMNRQGLLDAFNALAPNVNGYTRTVSLSGNSKSILNNVYVKDKGNLYTIILPTSDTSIQSGKTYYTYDEETDEYTQVTPDFTSDVIYHELVTSSWDEYEFCDSSDTGAMLTLDFVRNIKGYTVS